uniref:NudC domain-containing protein 1 n=1 Tax=Setaria digitata TaxID=48799 RepID=A0A915PDP3_9BILA
MTVSERKCLRSGWCCVLLNTMGSMSESFIDIKPNPSLLDSNFDGYKLSLDPFPIYSHPMQVPVRELQTSNTQYGLEHIKLFNDISYLTYDPYASDSGHKRFVTVLQDCHLCSIAFDVQTKKFSVTKNGPVIDLPSDQKRIQDRYPATVSFPSDSHAFISNGFGQLTMYVTGDRCKATVWEECLRVQPLTVDGEVNSFIINESRYVGNKFDLLLRSVLPNKRSSSHGIFSNKIIWLTVISENGEMKIVGTRNVICSGHIEMITFDSVPESLIVISTGELSFCGSGVNSSHISNQEMKEKFVFEDAETSELTKKKYAWSQTATDVTAMFTCDETISKKDVSLSLSATSVHLSVKGIILVGGTLGGTIDPVSSTYTIDDNKLELFLGKSGMGLTKWSELVVGDDQGTYEVDRESLNIASEMLERFTSESQILDSNGAAGRTFNIEQMEDCDVSSDDICKIRWLNCASQKLVHESDITTYNILFSVSLDFGPRFLCIRMDIDGILWKFTEGNRKIQHYATFNAFGYVQASKTQRKFSTCPADCSYAVIVEAKRHAFVYWQPSTIASDLRNRKTGRRVAGVAKQQLISLSKPSEFCDVCTVTENIWNYSSMSLSFVDDHFQFAEMNIRHTGKIDETMTMVRRAVRMGYDCVVINTDVGQLVQGNMNLDDEPPRKKPKKGNKGRNVIPDPVNLTCTDLDTSILEAGGKRLRIFSRLTATISNSTEVHLLMHHPQVKKYDLIAVRPSDEQILQTISKKGDFVDIITYEQASASVGWLNKSKIIQLCINDGMTFEITYADALKDSSQRREVLTNGRQLLMSTKNGNGVVIASGAERMIDIRAPYDAANISVLFGNAKKALLRAESRKTLKGSVLVGVKEELPKNLIARLNVIEKIMKIPEFRAQLEVVKDELEKKDGSELKSLPSRQFTQTLDVSQQEQLSRIITEVKCETQKQRFNHIKFCRHNELKELKCKAKHQRKVFDKLNTSESTSRFAMFVGTTQQKRIADQRRLLNHIHNIQMEQTPALLVDCRFLNKLSSQALSQTLIQLSYLASENRSRRRPWPLYFFNFDMKNESILEGRERYLSLADSPRNLSLTILSSSYLNFFSLDKIIYLSPHAEIELEEVDGSKAYVLGGIVDRVAQHHLHPHATILAANQDGVKVRRLPIDKYIKWKSGSKSMTLLAVSSILYSVYESCGDWETAFRKHVPVRNIRGPAEKNPRGRRLHAHIHDYERRLLAELNQRLQLTLDRVTS